MSGGRCHRRKTMMGRGVEGGCGTEERRCPVSRASSHAAASTASRAAAGVDFYAQARKALTEHSPFDDEEAFGRAVTLPVALAASLSKSSDGRRKHKKLLSEPVKKPPPEQPPVWSVWTETEEYFRPITLVDIDKLVRKLPFGGASPDPCLTIPPSQNIEGVEMKNAVATAAAEETEEGSNLAFADLDANVIGGTLEVVMGEEVGVNQHEEHQKEQPQQPEEEQNQDQRATEVDGVRISSADEGESTEKDGDLVGYSSLNWILGSKNRALLASERPNKKRKLLGGDAGLERLLMLPNSQGEGQFCCDYCCSGDVDGNMKTLLHCDSCKVSVHMKCYGVHDVPKSSWLCSWCRQLEVVENCGNKDGEGPCLLCPKWGGALKPVVAEVSEGGPAVKFAHLFCSLWMPEVYVDNPEMMEPIMNVGKVQETRKRLVCNLCKVKQGACIRCSHGTCRTSFHPVCARDAKQRMEIWGKGKCDDVELRAFCSKHSTIQDIGLVQHPRNPTLPISDDSSFTNALPVTSPTNNISKIRITRKERDKITGQENTTNISFGLQIENEIHSNQQESTIRARSDSSGVVPSQKTITAEELSNAVDNSSLDMNDLLLILKKWTDNGKISVADVALRMQIPSASLESALTGEATSLSSELTLKIVKWFKDYVHLGDHTRYLNSVSGSTFLRCAKDDGESSTNAAKVTGLGARALDTVLVKSLPPRRRTKSTVRILKDNKVVCSTGDTFTDETCNGKMVNEIVKNVLGGDFGGAACSGSPFHDRDYCGKEQEILEKMQEDASGCSVGSSFVQRHQQCNGNAMALLVQDKSVHHQQQPSVERVTAFGSGINPDVNLCDTLKLTLNNVSMQEQSECDVATVTTGPLDSKRAEPYSGALHPFIKKKLTKMQTISEAGSNGQQEIDTSLLEVDPYISNYSNNQRSHSFDTNLNHALDDTKLEQLSNAKGMGIMEISPEDELEGEILYLQNKLLNTTVTVKHRFENLIFRVVKHLPEELDLLKKRRWDLVMVNQFLRHVKEAKKRGRKEKRHKEYQAVLAAAAAAVETSSRISSLRKETNDEFLSASQEVDTGRVRPGAYPLASQAKESPSKLTAPKISPERQPETSGILCDICGRTETMLNRIFVCGGCKVAVHLDCYHRPRHPISSWFCEVCEELQSDSYLNVDDREKPFAPHCGLCGSTTGAFRKTVSEHWVHSFCAEWVLESTFMRGQENPVEGMEAVLKDREMLKCCICHQNNGICMKCSYGNCHASFHPFCARSVGLFMSVRIVNGKLQHKAYCEKHGTEQRQKADIQHYGAEELKSIKQIRVELEKVRLLCERIIRREKLKRELVLCSHDILASRRDYVTFSVLVNSSSFPLGVSSESATTSINNRSFSDTIQRSDDVTVDSSVSIKRRVRIPLRTEDGSTYRPVSARKGADRKGADRMAFSGKQIPQRAASVTSHNTIDGEKRLKPRKHMEIFQKEVMMTSDQASIQNRRLPKGFVYVPVDSLPNNRDIETPEPRKPDG